MKKITMTAQQYGEYLLLRWSYQREKVKYLNLKRADILFKIRGGNYAGRSLARYKTIYKETLSYLKQEEIELRKRRIEAFL